MEKTDVHVGKGDVDGTKKQRGCSSKSLSNFSSNSSKGKVLSGDGVKNNQRDEMDGDCKCQVCGQKFANDASLEKHMIITHASGRSIEVENGYQCSVCYKKFTALGSIRTHLKIHYEEDLLLWFSCALCGERFGHRYHLIRHRCDKLESVSNLQLIKNSVKGKASDYKCAVCDRMFTGKRSWKKHMNIHDLQKLQCQLCCLKFSATSKLKIHLRQHTEDYPSKCSWCPQRLDAKQNLKGHERFHDIAWRSCYACCMCRKSFVRQRNMEAHKCEVHQKGWVTKYLCNVCGESCDVISTLKIHMEAHSTTHPHTCFRCGRGFQSKESLMKHMKLRVLSSSLEDKRMGKKKVRNDFACGTMKRMDRPQKSLQTACTNASPNREVFPGPNKEELIKKSEDSVPKMHKGEQSQCRCALCGETLLCQFELSRHRCQSLDSKLLQRDKESVYIRRQNSKSKECKDYMCTVCNRIFKLRSSWRRHMAVHLRQDKYICPVCPRKFHNDKDARIHYMKLHTGGHPFKGKWCLSSYVNSHEKIHNQALHPVSGRSKKTVVDEDDDESESKPTKECRAKYRCDACCKNFSHLASYRKHVNKKHNMGVIHKESLPFCCALCGEKFTLRYHLSRHGCVALDTKVLECRNVTNSITSGYECAVCNRNFVVRPTWEAHMSLHLVKQEQQCPVCFLQIYDGKELDARSHTRTCDGESMPNEIEAKEKYLCSVCGKLYEFNPHLENRAIGVTEPNPYLCSLCSKGLGCKVNLTHQTEEQTEEHLLSRSQDSTSCVDDQGLCENQVMPNLTKHHHEENASSPDIHVCTEEVKECLDHQSLDDSSVMPGSTKCCLVEIQEDDNASDIYTEEEFVDDSDSEVMPDSSWQNFEEKYQCFLCDERLGTEDELKSHLQVHCS